MKELVNQLISDLHELSEIDATEQEEQRVWSEDRRRTFASNDSTPEGLPRIFGAFDDFRPDALSKNRENVRRQVRRLTAYLSAQEALMKLSAERSVFDVAQEIGECLAAWRIATVDHSGMLDGTTPRMTDDPSRIRARAMERLDRQDAWYVDRYKRTSSALQQALTLAKTL